MIRCGIVREDLVFHVDKIRSSDSQSRVTHVWTEHIIRWIVLNNGT